LVYAKMPARHRQASEDILLSDHQQDVSDFGQQIVTRLHIDASLINIYRWAGHHHDEGKRHPLWRTAMNCAEGEPLGKSGRRRSRPKLLSGLRHELVSLASVSPPPDWTEAQRDLALHLIACHHGWARPHFRENACDPDNLASSANLAEQSTLRFARLQRQYGAWGIAYLEAIFRAADWLASEGVTPEPEEQQDDN
jgi:CRISPR-associated endonuclease/helicase Cas3